MATGVTVPNLTFTIDQLISLIQACSTYALAGGSGQTLATYNQLAAKKVQYEDILKFDLSQTLLGSNAQVVKNIASRIDAIKLIIKAESAKLTSGNVSKLQSQILTLDIQGNSSDVGILNAIESWATKWSTAK